MIRSTVLSDTRQFDAGYRAERIFVLALFAFSSNAPRNGQSIVDLSIILRKRDLLGKTALRHSQSLIPDAFLHTFFFLYALERQITECQNDEQHMPLPADPASTLVMIQTQFFLQLLVTLLNPKPFVKKTNHLQSWHVLGHIAEKVSEFVFAIILFSSLDNQPDYFMSNSFPVALCRKNPSGDRLDNQWFIQRIPERVNENETLYVKI